MRKKGSRDTKRKIVAAAWKLFYEQGYDNTTVDDIIYESETSKGSFYHYFSGKDALLSSLSEVFDEKYEELAETLAHMADLHQFHRPFLPPDRVSMKMSSMPGSTRLGVRPHRGAPL